MNQTITFTGTVERFPGLGGWFYVKVPASKLPKSLPAGQWGFVKMTATLGHSVWETSLMPMGSGEKFVALKASVRKKEKVELGDEVSVSLQIRD